MRVGDGYSQITRGLIGAFTDLGVTVHSSNNWGDPEDPTPAMQAAINRGFGNCEFGLRLSQPDSFDACPGKVKLGMSMWEFDQVPRAAWRGPLGNVHPVKPWPVGMNDADINLVPCEHSRDLWAAAGYEGPLYVVPLGYDPAVFHQGSATATVTTWPIFVQAGTLSGRKNPQLLVDAYCEAFPEPRVGGPGLVLKSCAHLPVGKPAHRNDITVINENWSPEQLAALYRRCDVMVHPTQGEGFGLTMMEGMACGLPVIAPWWSAQRDYLNGANSWCLAAHWEDVGSDWCLDPSAGEPGFQRFRYMQPDYDNLVQHLRMVATSPEAVAHKSRAAVRTAARYTWRKTARAILEIIDVWRG